MDKSEYPEPRFCGFVGMPRALLLKTFANHIKDIFDSNVYLVGSALETKDWHDLDIVVVLSDDVWTKYGFGETYLRCLNKKWVAYCLAISTLGKKMLECEVDFQIINESIHKVFDQHKRLELT